MVRPWTEKFAPADPEKLARRAITLLENRILDEFGARVLMGAELEFTTGPQIPEHHPLSRATDPEIPSTLDYYAPARQKLPENAAKEAPGYENSPYISVLHRIIPPKSVESRQFELIFSHQAPYGTPEQGNLVNLARMIGAEKKHLTSDTQIPQLSFSACLTENGKQVTSGLHLNISLTDKEGFPLLGRRRDPAQPARFLPNARSQALMHGIEHMQQEGQYLLGHDPAHFERLQAMEDMFFPLYLRGQDADLADERLMRIENRIPAADSNPYMAVMLTLAGIYEGLRQHETSRTVKDTSLYPLPRDANEARRHFSESSSLIPLLNRLEPELGDQLRTAIKHKMHYSSGQAQASPSR